MPRAPGPREAPTTPGPWPPRGPHYPADPGPREAPATPWPRGPQRKPPIGPLGAVMAANHAT